MSTHLNILCISSDKPHYTENISACDVTVFFLSITRASVELRNENILHFTGSPVYWNVMYRNACKGEQREAAHVYGVTSVIRWSWLPQGGAREGWGIYTDLYNII